MSQLQKMLKALESEKEYQNYRRTEKIFKTPAKKETEDYITGRFG